MEARYYDAAIGRFISQDPSFLTVTSDLTNPQDWNSYSYVRNNPLNGIDPDGRLTINILGFLSNSSQVGIGNWANNLYVNSSVARYALNHPYQTGAALGITGGALVAGAVVASGGAITCGILCGSTAATVTTAGTAAASQADKVENTVDQSAKLLNGPINITADRLGHVMDEHTVGGINTAGNSIFNQGENVVNLIKQSTQQVIQKARARTSKEFLMSAEISGWIEFLDSKPLG